VLVSHEGDLAVLDAATGEVGDHLHLDADYTSAQRLPGGDLLLAGDAETARVGLAPLRTVWRVAIRNPRLVGDRVFAAVGDATEGKAWLSIVQLATGEERRIEVAHGIMETKDVPYEMLLTWVPGWSADDVDVAIEGYEDSDPWRGGPAPSAGRDPDR
jgi:hypothetical protein